MGGACDALRGRGDDCVAFWVGCLRLGGAECKVIEAETERQMTSVDMVSSGSLYCCLLDNCSSLSNETQSMSCSTLDAAVIYSSKQQSTPLPQPAPHFFPCFNSSKYSFGGCCRYPMGLPLVHLHKSTQASSSGLRAFQPSSFSARAGLAVRSKTSPSRLPTTSYGRSLPQAALKALIMWKTVLPLPVPRFQARTPGW